MKHRRWLIAAIIIFALLNTLACDIEGDMDRSWMTATVQAAIVKGEGR